MMDLETRLGKFFISMIVVMGMGFVIYVMAETAYTDYTNGYWYWFVMPTVMIVIAMVAIFLGWLDVKKPLD